jgi:uncharacterized membrane protein YphA (DoxX/SURF4 family)
MSTEKKVTTATKVIYWISTALIALSALSGIFFINKPESTEKMHHLGLPMWFAYEATIGSFIGGLILLIPMMKRVKEWAYVAFGITYISAFIAHITLDGFGGDAISAIIVFGILLLSYIYYHKIND